MQFSTLILIAVFAVSCAKKSFDRASQPKMDQVLDLNSGKPDKVIKELEAKASLDDDEVYYLSSAYTMKGGLDVASLYPLLEMYLFNQPAYKWDSLSAIKDPYKKFISHSLDKDSKESQDRRRIIIESYDSDLRWRFSVEKEEHCPEFAEYEKQLSELAKTALEKMRAAKIKSFSSFTKEFYGPKGKILSDRRFRGPFSGEFQRCDHALTNYHESHFLYSMLIENYVQGSTSEATGLTENWESLVLEVLWNTYEAIPFLQRVPDLDLGAQDLVTKSIDLQRRLLKNPEFKERASNNIIYLSVISILSIYKSSFQINEVHEIRDIFCQFEPEKIYPMYTILKARVQSLKDMISQQPDLNQKYSDYLQKIQRSIDLSPAFVTPESQLDFTRRLRSQKFEKCIMRDRIY